jgi:hypothetical protein
MPLVIFGDQHAPEAVREIYLGEVHDLMRGYRGKEVK